MSSIEVYTYTGATANIVSLEADGGTRRERGAKIAAAVRRLKADGSTAEKISTHYDEAYDFPARTTVRYRVTPPTSPIRTEALLAEIEAWQAANPYADGLFIPKGYHLETIFKLADDGLIVSGAKTSGQGNKIGWYSVRMINASHAKALKMNATYRVYGHGERDYTLVSREHGTVTLKPVNDGMVWAFDEAEVYQINV